MTMRSTPARRSLRNRSVIVPLAFGTGTSPTTNSSPTMPSVIERCLPITSPMTSVKATVLRDTSGCVGA